MKMDDLSQLARDRAELVEHLGRGAGSHLGRQVRQVVHLHVLVPLGLAAGQAVAASFCRIFCTFSSSVAFVNGFTM